MKYLPGLLESDEYICYSEEKLNLSPTWVSIINKIVFTNLPAILPVFP